MALKTKTKFVASLIAVIVATTMITYAVVQYTQPITNTASIAAYWHIHLWRVDTGEVINAIDWGEIQPSSYVSTNMIWSGTCARIHNDGNSEVFVGWALDPATPLPSGVTLTARIEGDYNSGIYWDWAQNTFNVLSGIAAGGDTGRVEFKLTVDATAPPGPFTFTINLYGADTNTG